jgi:hypothetical protein
VAGRFLGAAALIAALGCVACSRGVQTRCERVCRVEAECADRLELPDRDSTECMETCAELERDPHTARLVEAHLRCVAAAPACPELLECQ